MSLKGTDFTWQRSRIHEQRYGGCCPWLRISNFYPPSYSPDLRHFLYYLFLKIKVTSSDEEVKVKFKSGFSIVEDRDKTKDLRNILRFRMNIWKEKNKTIFSTLLPFHSTNVLISSRMYGY